MFIVWAHYSENPCILHYYVRMLLFLSNALLREGAEVAYFHKISFWIGSFHLFPPFVYFITNVLLCTLWNENRNIHYWLTCLSVWAQFCFYLLGQWNLRREPPLSHVPGSLVKLLRLCCVLSTPDSPVWRAAHKTVYYCYYGSSAAPSHSGSKDGTSH